MTVRALLLSAMLAGSIAPACAPDIVGKASVIDGDTIEIHGQRIRLWGIDALESDQLCRGDDSKHDQCGRLAANALATLFIGIPHPVACSRPDVISTGARWPSAFSGSPGRISESGL